MWEDTAQGQEGEGRHLKLRKDGMKLKELLPFVRVRHWQPRILKENEAEGSSWEELEILLPVGGSWD